MLEVDRHCDKNDELHDKVTDSISLREEGNEDKRDNIAEEAEDECHAPFNDGNLTKLAICFGTLNILVKIVEKDDAKAESHSVADDRDDLQIGANYIMILWVQRAKHFIWLDKSYWPIKR